MRVLRNQNLKEYGENIAPMNVCRDSQKVKIRAKLKAELLIKAWWNRCNVCRSASRAALEEFLHLSHLANTHVDCAAT